MSFFDIIDGIFELFNLFSGGSGGGGGSSRSTNGRNEERKEGGIVLYGTVFYVILFFAACFLLSCNGIFSINYLIPVLIANFIVSFIFALVIIGLLNKFRITEPLRFGSFIYFLLTLMVLIFTLILFLIYRMKIFG